MQLSRFVSIRPLLVQRNTLRREAERVIGGGGDKHRRRICRNGNVFRRPAGIDGGDESGTAFRRVFEGNANGDRSARREPYDADAVWRDSPFRRMLADVG